MSERLNKDLPGDSVRNIMRPSLLSGKSIQITHNEKPRKGGVLILLFNYGGNAYFPLIQRPVYEGVHSGQIALPGGRFETSDKDLVETALRETEEEIGISRDVIQVVGTLTECYVAASNYDILPVVGIIKGKPTFIPDPKEVKGIITPSLLQLVDRENQKETVMTVSNGLRLKSPYFHLENQVVWGATAMMLSELVAVLQEY